VKRCLLVALVVVLLASPWPALLCGCSASTSHSSVAAKAAIIDQLYSLHPNEEFIAEVTTILEDYGFEVDVYQGDEVTVDFYRQLPSYGHKLIILRTHSGAMRLGSQDAETIVGICLFTNELYSKTKHPKEQLNGELLRARVVEDSPDFFGIGAKFVTSSMKGSFDSTVVVVDGCSCLYNEELAEAFTEKGASAFIAWDATVDLDYVDRATIYLMRQLCVEKVTIEKTVEGTMNVLGLDPESNAILKYYPLQSGSKTLDELVAD